MGLNEEGVMEFENNEEKEIEILIPALQKEDTVKVYVYETNGAERVCDTLIFKIQTEPVPSVSNEQ